MTDLEILHFERLKKEVQAQFLKNHTPSFDDISKWKGIDIIYFQEDLRKSAKGNISEKSFYTYFKNSPSSKLPRIDMLNLLCIYAGYQSWHDFRKNHFADENTDEEIIEKIAGNSSEQENIEKTDIQEQKDKTREEETTVLQKNNTDNQLINKNKTDAEKVIEKPLKKKVKDWLWLAISVILAFVAGILGFRDQLFSRKYYYSFIDGDRNSKINAELQVQILKENESPILYTAKPNEPFVYTTKSKSLIMVVSSPYYKTDTIRRNLETAPEAENIELKPNDYAIMLYYYSKSIKDLKRKRERLSFIISDNALIYQVYDSDDYGIETMDKQRYISLVTLPTTSLENLEVIDTQNDKKTGKINMIKFRIKNDEKSQ